MWNGVPAPASVMRSRWSTGIVVAGTNDSTNTPTQPVSAIVKSHPMPPMWVNGNTIAARSASVTSSASIIPTAEALTVRSV